MTTAGMLEEIRKLRVLVAGDVCLDRWCLYDPELADISRETGIPRIAVVATEVSPGAAGTIASNVAALGARVDVLGVAGADGFGFELKNALAARGIGSDLLVTSPEVPTFTYTKLMRCGTGEEDLPRVDFVNTRPIPLALETELVRRLESAAGRYDVVLISDQAETAQGGVVTPAVRHALERFHREDANAVIWVDSRMRAEHFREVVVKPNRSEAEAASQRALGRIDFEELRRFMKAPLLVITQGGEGATVVAENGATFVATEPNPNPVDICGAGDSFSAGAAMALRITRDAIAAAEFGNRMASITIRKKGTGTASPEELLA